MTGTDEHAPYPVRVDAARGLQPSRWRRLVTWLLLLPHVVVLAFLWPAHGTQRWLARRP